MALDPIWGNKNLLEDVEKYEARAESKEISFKKCNHKSLVKTPGMIRCKCGAAWGGPGLDRLYKALTA